MENNIKVELEKQIQNISKKYGIEADKARKLISDIIVASKEEMKPASKKVAHKASGRTKPLTKDSERVRKALLIMRAGLKGKQITAVELAEQLNTNLNTVNNNLRYLATENIVKQVGTLKTAGRGKNPMLWQFR